MEVLIRCADRLGIERIILSQGYSADLHPTQDQLREENNRVMRAVRRFPERAFGSVYLSPSFRDFSLQEFDRCVRDGPMVGVGEREADMRCNGPELDPIVERAISMKAPILQHTWLKLDGNLPGESSPYDLVELARRYTDANFICAHTGGDWERGIRVIRNTKNICAEIAGFDPTAGVVEMAVRDLGPERVVYGSDVGGGSFASEFLTIPGFIIGILLSRRQLHSLESFETRPEGTFYTTLPGREHGEPAASKSGRGTEEAECMRCHLRVFAQRGKLPESPFLLHREHRRSTERGERGRRRRPRHRLPTKTA